MFSGATPEIRPLGPRPVASRPAAAPVVVAEPVAVPPPARRGLRRLLARLFGRP